MTTADEADARAVLEAQVAEWRGLPRAQLAYYVQRGKPVTREVWGTAGRFYSVELHLAARADGSFHGIALVDDYGALGRERPLRMDFEVPADDAGPGGG